ALLEGQRGEGFDGIHAAANRHGVAGIGRDGLAVVDEEALIQLRLRVHIGGAELEIVAPRKGNTVIESVPLEKARLVGRDELVRRLMIEAPQVRVADSGGE